MDPTPIFLSGAQGCKEFTEALDIVRKNSTGKIWLIGGFVYRTIANQLYGAPKPDVDLDFIVEIPVQEFNMPVDWKIYRNSFGNPKLVNGKKQIDYVPLRNVYSILQRNIEPTIENFLTGAPLTIQSIVYDVNANNVIGNIGINALQKRIVEINNLFFAEYAAQRKNKSLRAMIQEKADRLGFTPVFPDTSHAIGVSN
jgi:hypothetical protein